MGTFELGWKIGTGINAKFLHIGIPSRQVDAASAEWRSFKWTPTQLHSFYGATFPQQAGWVATFRYNGTSYNRWFEEPCTFSGFVPPSPFQVLGPLATTAQCRFGPGSSDIAPTRVLYAWAAEQSLVAPGPIESYSNQAYSVASPAPNAPSQSSAEDAIEDALGDPENESLRDWLNYVLGSPGQSDPLGNGPDNPSIEFPDFIEHWEEHADEFPDLTDPYEYWRRAAQTVERARDGTDGYLRCERPSDGAEIVYDVEENAIVVVKNGKIVTFFKPGTGSDYFFNQCNS